MTKPDLTSLNELERQELVIELLLSTQAMLAVTLAEAAHAKAVRESITLDQATTILSRTVLHIRGTMEQTGPLAVGGTSLWPGAGQGQELDSAMKSVPTE